MRLLSFFSVVFTCLSVLLGVCLLTPPAQAGRIDPPVALSFSRQPPGVLSNLDRRQASLMEKLNRADRRNMRRLPAVIVPSRWDLEELDYSPMPARYEWAAQHNKTLVVHQPSQVFGAYERGRLVRWGPVSSGRQQHPTPSGLFYLNWRARDRRSSVDETWRMEWYFNFESRRGLAFHKYSMPGRPASHACIRLLERDARWLYDWGEGWKQDESGGQLLRQGTPVVIVGSYNFGAERPWLRPQWWNSAISLPASP